MVFLLVLIASLVLFTLDIQYRYLGGTSVACYQAISLLLAAVSVPLLFSLGKWVQRKIGLRFARSSASSPRDRMGMFLLILSGVVGAALVFFTVWTAVGRVFLEPATLQSGSSPVALLQEALGRWMEGASPYGEPYDMGGWETRLSAMPGLVWLQTAATGLGLDIRLIGVLALAGMGIVGFTLILQLISEWRNGTSTHAALAAAALLFVGTAFFSLSLATLTFVRREPSPILWLVIALFAVAVARKAWILGSLLLAVAVSLSLPTTFLAPVYFAGVVGHRETDPSTPPEKSRFPNLAVAIFAGLLVLMLLPLWKDLGELARSVIETPFQNARYYAEKDLLGTRTGLAWLAHAAGLLPLLPLLFLIALGEIINRARKRAPNDPEPLLRLLALTLLLLGLLAPLPTNTTYWPFLVFLLVAGGAGAAWETRRTDSDRLLEDLPRRRQFVAAGLGGLMVLAAVAAFLIRIEARPPIPPLQERTDGWSGRDLLVSGFHAPEGEQVWMSGTRGVINLPVIDRQNGTLVLRLSVVGAEDPRTNRLLVELNGGTVYGAVFETGTLNRIEIPIESRQVVVGPNTLTLLAEWADSPVNLGLPGSDTRTLSFGFYGLQWQPESSP